MKINRYLKTQINLINNLKEMKIILRVNTIITKIEVVIQITIIINVKNHLITIIIPKVIKIIKEILKISPIIIIIERSIIINTIHQIIGKIMIIKNFKVVNFKKISHQSKNKIVQLM